MASTDRISTVIKSFLISEKASNQQQDNNTLVLIVDPRANKVEIAQAVKLRFDMEVVNVRTVNVKGKSKRRGNVMGKRKDWKKAYVTVVNNTAELTAE